MLISHETQLTRSDLIPNPMGRAWAWTAGVALVVYVAGLLVPLVIQRMIDDAVRENVVWTPTSPKLVDGAC